MSSIKQNASNEYANMVLIIDLKGNTTEARRARSNRPVNINRGTNAAVDKTKREMCSI